MIKKFSTEEAFVIKRWFRSFKGIAPWGVVISMAKHSNYSIQRYLKEKPNGRFSR
ncbi:hypothetical protein NBRC116493_21210 [Aurantivibrio infirmus]